MKAVVCVLISWALVLTACSEDPSPKRQARSRIEDSFSLPTGIQTALPAELKDSPSALALGTGTQGRLILKKEALGKAFLMSPSMVIASNSPILNHGQSLVVMFESFGDRLGLFELNLRSFYDDLPSNKLLQTFRVWREDETSIEFEWAYGLEYWPQKTFSHASDRDTLTGADDEAEPVVAAMSTFVRRIALEGDTLQIEQVSRLRGGKFRLSPANFQKAGDVDLQTEDLTVQMNVRLRPYVLNPRFIAKESELLKGIGYFEQRAWDRAEGREVVQARRWDLSPERGPLVYALTANTPADSVDAVKEGVLSWNRAFGRDVIRVETGADPREPARDRRVLVHWVDWPAAGFARASLQVDPFTGEILAANVYMTSSFVKNSARAVRGEARAEESLAFLSASGFESASACSWEREGVASETLSSADRLDEATVLRVTRDTVRYTVAHEVGHTLGLRHNFAGSMESSLETLAETRVLQKDYLAGARSEGAALTSSVMDYLVPLDVSMTGATLLARVLPYDLKAIEWGYGAAGARASELKAPAFCTDGQRAEPSLTVGCETFDRGRQPLSAKVDSMERARDNVLQASLRTMIAALHPQAPKRPLPLEELRARMNQMNLKTQTESIYAEAGDLRSAAAVGAAHVQARVQIGRSGWLLEGPLRELNRELLRAEWKTVDGYAATLRRLLPFAANGDLPKGWMDRSLTRVLESPELEAGVTIEGVAYRLNEAERETMTGILRTMAKTFEGLANETVLKKTTIAADEKVTAAMKALTGREAPMMDVSVLDARDEADLGVLAKGLVLPVDHLKTMMVKTTAVEVPVARFPLALRAAALRWLSPKAFGQDGWGAETRAQIRSALISRLRRLGAAGDLSTLIEANLRSLGVRDEAKKWASEEIALLKAVEAMDQEEGSARHE